MTRLDNKFYAVCSLCPKIFVYSGETPYHQLEAEGSQIPEMRDPVDVIGIKECRAIFISDQCDNGCLWKIEMPGNKTSRWPIEGSPRTLSSNSEDQLLVLAEMNFRKYLDVYDASDVSRAKRISLPNNIQAMRHVVQTTRGTYILAYFGASDADNTQWLISEISISGTFIITFDRLSMLLNPVHLAIDIYDQIIVTDFANQTIYLVNSQLTSLQSLMTKNQHNLIRPGRLCYMGDKQQLVVGQSRLPDDTPAASFSIVSLGSK